MIIIDQFWSRSIIFDLNDQGDLKVPYSLDTFRVKDHVDVK